MKGRTCTDGQKQRKKVVPGESTPPTVSMDSVIIMEKIDAHEGRNVRICDTPGVFSQCRHGRGRENGAAWEVSGTNGKYCAPNIHSLCDILEGEAGPLCHHKGGAIRLPKIIIYVI